MAAHYIMKHVLHSSPSLNEYEKDGLIKTRTEIHLQLFVCSFNATLAIKRDLKNYAIYTSGRYAITTFSFMRDLLDHICNKSYM